LFCEITANTKISNLFQVKFEYGKKTVSSFAKMENPEKKSFRIACGRSANDESLQLRVVEILFFKKLVAE
jgi:hypothetical protein